jgi:hypothetical protein
MNEQMFAAYDLVAIYGIGASPEEAIANAKWETRNMEASFSTAPIDAGLAGEIIRAGWNGAIDCFDLIGGVIKRV